MNNPSLKSYYVVTSEYYVVEHLSDDILADVSSFSSGLGKIYHVASLNPISRHITEFLKKKIGNV